MLRIQTFQPICKKCKFKINFAPDIKSMKIVTFDNFCYRIAFNLYGAKYLLEQFPFLHVIPLLIYSVCT